jgi:hypothetical protein
LARIFAQPRLEKHLFSALAGPVILILSALIGGYGDYREIVMGRC